MKGNRFLEIFVGILIVGMGVAQAGEYPDAPAKGSAEFERIKQFEGRWQGVSSGMGSPEEKVEVVYHVTSGASAVVETLFPGTPHEMVSVYTERDDKISMTHYCMLGNQPKLQLTAGDDKRFDFSLAEDADIHAATEKHMHALTLSFAGSDQLTQRWACFEGGKEKDSIVITLTRVP